MTGNASAVISASTLRLERRTDRSSMVCRSRSAVFRGRWASSSSSDTDGLLRGGGRLAGEGEERVVQRCGGHRETSDGRAVRIGVVERLGDVYRVVLDGHREPAGGRVVGGHAGAEPTAQLIVGRCV